ncbi:MAG: arginine--tRNA ligase [Sphingobacteriales bacterium JAD_PAG50586_3]|nr:MAG: arginine--tRNA ligase [Sphingobacteriales bacterium JAD_PAG50586_3]
MAAIESILLDKTKLALAELYGADVATLTIKIEHTNPQFEGDYTVNVFPFLKISGKKPEDTATEMGNWFIANNTGVNAFNVVKGFLNLSVENSFWMAFFAANYFDPAFGIAQNGSKNQTVMVEYPSPNTNKPLHLGHLRNIFLGSSVAELMKANGYNVVHACLYNDRGTNICKSMLAYQKWGKGETPESEGIKGDHLVGNYYVKFATEFKKQVEELVATGISKDDAEKQAPLTAEVNDMLVKWEAGDEATRTLWQTMNGWVYQGFDITYQTLGIKPDKYYYESDVYNLGKETVAEGLEKGIFYQKEDGSIWIDLTAEGLDQKVVLRSNGTTVYITQDIAVANEKEKDYKIDKSVYVVGNEQDYHFKVLFLILKKLGRAYADNLYHLSYGMVELPTGKMKSREGTVVDADDLMEMMIESAKQKTVELGKIDGLSDDEANKLFHTLGMGALRYFILKVDPKKKMLFNPEESIDFNGHTGPFIQYTHARIRSVLRKAEKEVKHTEGGYPEIHAVEKALIKRLYAFPATVQLAAESYDPALVANYAFFLAGDYNRFYHELTILKEENAEARDFRLALSLFTANVIKQSLCLLGVDAPERM